VHPIVILRLIAWASKAALAFVLGVSLLVLKTGTTGLRAIKGGTSAGSAPTYNATTGDYTIDGPVVWLAEGSSNNDSILDYGVWDANRRFALGYWAVKPCPRLLQRPRPVPGQGPRRPRRRERAAYRPHGLPHSTSRGPSCRKRGRTSPARTGATFGPCSRPGAPCLRAGANAS
jgi:hypothetical protein